MRVRRGVASRKGAPVTKAAKWVPVENVRAFMAQQGTKRTGDHNFSGRVLHWPYCKVCGLLLLRNAATQRAAAATCVTYE
jgi:hypothetical protein